MSTTNINPDRIRTSMGRFWEEVHRVLKGCDGTTRVMNETMLGGGHSNCVGVPGTGKSLMVEAMAKSMGGRANIFSFTADMMPTDIVGSEVYDPETGKMIVMTGFIDPENPFTLGDEYNRAPEKTMSAFMEPLQTGRVRQGRHVAQIKPPFFFVGVKNPVEQGGTYPTPEAMLDRFMSTTVIGYAGFDAMVKLTLDSNLGRFNPIEAAGLQKVLEPAELGEFIEFVRTQVELPEKVAQYIARICAATRPPEDPASTDDPWMGEEYTQWMPDTVEIGTGKAKRTCSIKDEGVILVGASNRGLLALAGLAKARAVMMGRTVVTDQDVKDIAVQGLAHRLTPNKQRVHKYPQHLMRVIVRELLNKVPTVK